MNELSARSIRLLIAWVKYSLDDSTIYADANKLVITGATDKEHVTITIEDKDNE